MIRYFTSIALVPFLLPAFSSLAYAGRIERSTNDCHQVGVILKSDDPNMTGFLCEGDRLVLESKIQISCKFKPSLEWLQSGDYDVNRLCPPKQREQVCKDGQFCYRSPSRIALIGYTFGSPKRDPTLRWTSIDGAKGYEIIIQSLENNEIRRKRLSSPEYRPESSFAYGLHQIDIYALGTDKSSTFAFYILSENELADVKSAIDLIESKPWTPKDKTIYQDSVYMRYGILPEAIAVLENYPGLARSSRNATKITRSLFASRILR